MQLLTKQAMHKMLSVMILAFLPVMGFSEEAGEGEKIFSKKEINKNINNCFNYVLKHWGDHADKIIVCLKKEYSVSDAILNKRYHSMVISFDENFRVESHERTERRLNALKQAQRQWITFRDKECGFMAEAEKGNSGSAISKYICLIDQTYERVNKLSEYIDCPTRFESSRLFLCPLSVG
jgi:uncharacterized protein YecT (DUF1311 family)